MVTLARARGGLALLLVFALAFTRGYLFRLRLIYNIWALLWNDDCINFIHLHGREIVIYIYTHIQPLLGRYSTLSAMSTSWLGGPTA